MQAAPAPGSASERQTVLARIGVDVQVAVQAELTLDELHLMIALELQQVSGDPD